MLRRHVEHVAGHFGVWALKSQHLDRQPERKYQEHDAEEPPDEQRACDVHAVGALVQEPRAQQQECYREADEHEGDQDEPDDHLARSLPGDPHRRLLLQPSPRATARAGGGVGAHPVARAAPRKNVMGRIVLGPSGTPPQCSAPRSSPDRADPRGTAAIRQVGPPRIRSGVPITR